MGHRYLRNAWIRGATFSHRDLPGFMQGCPTSIAREECKAEDHN